MMDEGTDSEKFYKINVPFLLQEFLVKGSDSLISGEKIAHPEGALTLDVVRKVLRILVLHNLTGKNILLDSSFNRVEFDKLDPFNIRKIEAGASGEETSFLDYIGWEEEDASYLNLPEGGSTEVNEARNEVLRILYDSCVRLQKALAEIFKQNGNTVFFQKPSFEEITKPRLERRKWAPSASRDGWVLKCYDRTFGPNKMADDIAITVPDHPNLVPEKYFRLVSLHDRDLGSVGTAPDLSEIPTLDEVMGDMSPVDKLRLVVDAMKGCEFLHRNGLVHRDVKPENIMVFGNVGKLADHEFVTSSYPERFSEIAGTPLYLDFYWYQGRYSGINVNSYRKIPAVDTFAFAVTILKTYLPKETGEKTISSIMDCGGIRELRGWAFYPELNACIPEDELELIGRMLKFRQLERPPLSEVIDFYQKKYKF